MASEKFHLSFADPFSDEKLDIDGLRAAPSHYEFGSLSVQKGEVDTSQLPAYGENVDTMKATINFGPIAAKFHQQAVEREERAAKFPDLEPRLQNVLNSLQSPQRTKSYWKFSMPGSRRQLPDETFKDDLQDLIRKHFSYRSEVEVYITDFKESEAYTHPNVKLSEIHKYWHEKPSDVLVRWLHVPIGLGPLSSTLQDLFLYAGKDQNRGRPFTCAGLPEWPYIEIEVLSFLDRKQFQTMRDLYHHCNDSFWAAEINDNLDKSCWKGFPPQAHSSKRGLLWDLKWRTTHLGLKKQSSKDPQPDWQTLPDFWTACYSDIPWQLNEGLYKRSYAPIDNIGPKFLQSDRQTLHSKDSGSFFGSAQAVRDPLKSFHRKDGMLLTMSSMRGVNYLDRFFDVHLRENRGAIFENDVASAIAFARKRFKNEGTENWPEKSVVWFLTYLIAEIGITPHCSRGGCNAPSLASAYQNMILEFRHQRDDHFSRENRQEPAKLIQRMLVCKDELKRISIINQRKERLFQQLVTDLRNFETEDRRLNDAQRKSYSAVPDARPSGQEGSEDHQSSRPFDPSKLPSAVEIASFAARRMGSETEAFIGLSEEIDMIIKSVYELRSIQQREVGGITNAQNNALFILTVVLTVFVPITTITGYLGMNLSDVRSTDWTQAHFWRSCGCYVLALAFFLPAAALIKMLIGIREGREYEGSRKRWHRLGSMPAPTLARTEGKARSSVVRNAGLDVEQP